MRQPDKRITEIEVTVQKRRSLDFRFTIGENVNFRFLLDRYFINQVRLKPPVKHLEYKSQ